MALGGNDKVKNKIESYNLVIDEEFLVFCESRYPFHAQYKYHIRYIEGIICKNPKIVTIKVHQTIEKIFYNFNFDDSKSSSLFKEKLDSICKAIKMKDAEKLTSFFDNVINNYFD